MLVIGSFKLAHILKADKISVHMTHYIFVGCPYRLSISMMDIFGFQVADPVGFIAGDLGRKENIMNFIFNIWVYFELFHSSLESEHYDLSKNTGL